jgi:hypothetical protein
MDLRILGVLSRAYQPHQVYRRLVSGRRLLFLTCQEGYPCAVIIGVREYDKKIGGNVFIRRYRTDHTGVKTVTWNNMDYRSFGVGGLLSDLTELVSDVL